MEGSNLLLKGLVGSHAYGYATDQSDKDYMSVVFAPLDCYFGLGGLRTSMSVTEDIDNTKYEFLKFMKLCSSFNPHVIPLLFTDKELSSSNWKLASVLLENKHLFMTKLSFNTLVGYSINQRGEAAKQITGKLGQKRKELIKKYGYDVKAASHTIRLLKTAEHLFKYNEFKLDVAAVKCAEYRLGKYSWEDFEDEFEYLKKNAELAFEKCTLPDTPDYQKINSLCVKLLGAYHYAVEI